MNSSFLYLLGDCINTIACVRNTKAIQSSYISKVTSSEILSQVRSSPLGEEWFSHSRLYQPSDRKQKGNSAYESRRYKCKCADCDYDCQERIAFAPDSYSYTRRFAISDESYFFDLRRGVGRGSTSANILTTRRASARCSTSRM